MKLIPLARNSKSPLAGEDWHNRISDDPAEHARWLRQGLNLGMPLEENVRVVVDFDDKEQARAFYRLHRDLATVCVETRRGLHAHFSGTAQTRQFDGGDLIKGNGYVVWKGTIQGWTYKH